MAQAAPQHPYAAVSSPEPDRFGAVAAGGPIADLQRTIEQRLIAADQPMMHSAEGAGVAHRLSRLAGPTLLVAAYGAVALWLFLADIDRSHGTRRFKAATQA